MDDYSITWNDQVVTITHNLNSRVIGALYNSNNEQVFIGINYINNNNISIDFSDIPLNINDQFTLLLIPNKINPSSSSSSTSSNSSSSFSSSSSSSSFSSSSSSSLTILTNWNDVHNIIQSGQAQDYFELGDVLTTNHEVYGEIQWQIVAFDQAETVDTSIQHSMTLLSLNCLGTRVWDCPESSGAPDRRNQYGYNKWSESNIRQWLNSNETANNWFTPQNEYDLCSYSNENGFMKGFTDSNFLNCLTTVKNTTALNTVDAGGGSEITEDIFWLPSTIEIFGENIHGITEGVYWSETFPDQYSRIKYNNNHNNSSWWLRSPNTDYANWSYRVHFMGSSLGALVVKEEFRIGASLCNNLKSLLQIGLTLNKSSCLYNIKQNITYLKLKYILKNNGRLITIYPGKNI